MTFKPSLCILEDFRAGGEVLCVCIEFAISKREKKSRQNIPERSEEMYSFCSKKCVLG